MVAGKMTTACNQQAVADMGSMWCNLPMPSTLKCTGLLSMQSGSTWAPEQDLAGIGDFTTKPQTLCRLTVTLWCLFGGIGPLMVFPYLLSSH
uniref:Uncharacterized protein n=1 Tax=Arundo donax TaxID=35708 RepID=A0A0A9H7C4_ARUDO